MSEMTPEEKAALWVEKNPKSDQGIWNICNGRAIRVSCIQGE